MKTLIGGQLILVDKEKNVIAWVVLSAQISFPEPAGKPVPQSELCLLFPSSFHPTQKCRWSGGITSLSDNAEKCSHFKLINMLHESNASLVMS